MRNSAAVSIICVMLICPLVPPTLAKGSKSNYDIFRSKDDKSGKKSKGLKSGKSGFGGRRIVIQMKGTAMMESRNTPVPDDPLYGEDDMLMCYDVPIYDLYSGEMIGMGTDCLDPEGPDPTCGGFEIIGTSVFQFQHGTIITRGETSVQETTFGSESVTHITGSIPGPDDNSILYADGSYKGAEGPVRLSGAVNMANAPEEISFDCIFVIDC